MPWTPAAKPLEISVCVTWQLARDQLTCSWPTEHHSKFQMHHRQGCDFTAKGYAGSVRPRLAPMA